MPILMNSLISGVNPSGMAITCDGKYLYVANNNNYGIPNQDSVTVIDAQKNRIITTIYDPSFNQPYAITIYKNKAYVMNSNSSTITIINTIDNKVIGIINGFDGPSGMVISLDGNIGYINNYGGSDGKGSGNGNTISVIDLKNEKIIQEIQVGLAPVDLAMTPDGKKIYVINYESGTPNSGTISIINTETNTVIGNINGFFGPFNIRISPNGIFAYVSNFGSNNFSPFGTTLSIINLNMNIIIKTITLGIQPSGIAISPNGKTIYVTNYNTLYQDPINFNNLTSGQGIVNIIDADTHYLYSKTIEVSQSPANAIISPNGQYLYISGYMSNVINIIKLTNE
jgi:YVTN family beta-propeller protein